MNKIFKVVWSKVRNSYVVVSEVAKANGKSGVKSVAVAAAVAVMMSGSVMSAEAAEITADTTIGGIAWQDNIDNGVTKDTQWKLNDNKLTIEGEGQYGYAVWANNYSVQGDEGSTLEIKSSDENKLTYGLGVDGTVNVDNLIIETVDQAIYAAAKTDIDANNINISADGYAVYTEPGCGVVLDVDAKKTATINGSIFANGATSVSVSAGKMDMVGNVYSSNSDTTVGLGTEGSLTGQVVTYDNSSTTLDMGKGSTWNVTGDSKVSVLAGSGANINVGDGVKEIYIADNQTDNVSLSKDATDKTVTKEDLAGLKNVLKGDVADIKVDATMTNANITGDVTLDENDQMITTIDTDKLVSTGDVVAGDVSLKETAAQVEQNKADIATNRDNIATNKADIAANADAIADNAQAIADEATARENADKALQSQVDTNAAGIAANKADIATNTANIATNAANIQQNTNAIAGLNNRVTSLDGRLDKVGAGAAALAALHPLDYDSENKLSFSAGVGNYAGSTAAAVGAFYRPNEDVMFSIGGTAGNGENMVNAGVSFAIGKGSSGVAKMSKAELVQEVTSMKAENEELKQENKDIRNELNKLKELVMKLAEEK